MSLTSFLQNLLSINSKSEKYYTLSIVTLVIFSFLILLRYPPLLLDPRFWAEEYYYYETFLHVQNWWEGLDALIYPAYYIGLSRVAGLLASLASVQYGPLITSLFSFLVLITPLIIIFLGTCKYWDNLKSKIVLSLFLIFSCSTGEIWLTSTNLGFIMPVISFLILLDENLLSKFKRLIYIILLSLAVLTGPITLLMSPFFLFRYIQKREPQFFIYCLILLIFGIFQILFFLTSSSLDIGSQNRIFIETNLSQRITYLISSNIIFPTLGYFVSIIFRTSLDIINLGVENSNILQTLSEILPDYPYHILELIFFYASKLNVVINIFLLTLLTFIFYHLFKRTSSEMKLYFLALFLYLAVIINFLSLGGTGGFRYSYLTSFILLFFLYQQFFLENNKFTKKIIRNVLIISVSVGIFEYYPRIISYSPENLGDQSVDWPNWEEEVLKWEKDDIYKPKIWPYIKNQSNLWPKRTEVFYVNLNEPETWMNQGKKRFSKEMPRLVKKIINSNAINALEETDREKK